MQCLGYLGDLQTLVWGTHFQRLWRSTTWWSSSFSWSLQRPLVQTSFLLNLVLKKLFLQSGWNICEVNTSSMMEFLHMTLSPAVWTLLGEFGTWNCVYPKSCWDLVNRKKYLLHNLKPRCRTVGRWTSWVPLDSCSCSTKPVVYVFGDVHGMQCHVGRGCICA